MAESNSKPHALMIALPLQGHITPFVSLAIKLASKGFAITFVHTEFIHNTLFTSHHSNTSSSCEVDLFSQARESGLDISYTTISDGFPLEFDRALHAEEYWESMLIDFPARVDEFVGKRIQEFDPIFLANTFLIADTFYSWPATIAEKYNMLNVSFWTQPALVFSITYHLELLRENGHYPCKDNIDEQINYIPGVEPISTRDLMPSLKESESTILEQKILLKSFEEVKKADFILCNTVDKLEYETLSALNQKQPTYAIGPVNFFRNLTAANNTKSLWSESNCTEWLDSKPPGSVLYISFGSFVQISKQLIEEIAYGLLLSEVNFIWVVRADIVSSVVEANFLPVGFEDEIKDRGLIISWCNQIMVLSNPAVGGFLTHCGWNSTLESIWCDVPMICYPLSYDQPVNRKLLVDDWKIGINLSDGVSINRKEVAEKIKSFMSGLTSEGLKQEVKTINMILHNALDIDGSSEINFDQFIKDFKAKFHSDNKKVPTQ